MVAQRYRRVGIGAWSLRCAAGDAPAAWAACRDQRPRLVEDADLGWHAPVTDVPTGADRLMELAARCAGPLWQGGPGSAAPFLSCAASKGDTPLLLGGEHIDPSALVPALPGNFVTRLAGRLGLSGPFRYAAPVAACSTGLYAVLAGADAVEHGLAEQALCGAADASLQPLLLAGFRRMGVLCRERPSAFSGAGSGFAPGEGAGFVMLQASGPWRLVGGVRLGDARHVARCEDPAVLRRCLEELWELLPEPGLIVSHGTGTAVGDAYELAGLDAGPWRDAPRLCCKPVIGHCLGASGAVELALALESPARRLWKLGLGFGGHVAALALERQDG